VRGDVNNPQSLDLYSYVTNNPTTLNDPSGQCGCGGGGGFLGGGGWGWGGGCGGGGFGGFFPPPPPTIIPIPGPAATSIAGGGLFSNPFSETQPQQSTPWFNIIVDLPLPPWPPIPPGSGGGGGEAGVAGRALGVLSFASGTLGTLRCIQCKARCAATWMPLLAACSGGSAALFGTGVLAGGIVDLLAGPLAGLGVEGAIEVVNHKTFEHCKESVEASLDACYAGCTSCSSGLPTGP